MTGPRRSMLALGLLTACAFPAFSWTPAETVNYSYDVRGRLVQVSRSGTINNGVSACYSYDRADNRTNVTVATTDCSGGPTTPSFSIGAASGTEGGVLVFTVTRSGPTTSGSSVNYATVNGTATGGADFTAASGTLTFASGEVSRTISISTIDDTAVEGSEAFVVGLSGPSGGATISVAQGSGTIADNDSAPPPAFSVSDASAAEGGPLVFTVTKTGSVTGSFSVSYGTSNGTAAAGSDYTAASGTLTFAAGETGKSVTVPTIDDASVESVETLTFTLSNATGSATISDAVGAGTISDNDTPAGPSFSIDDASAGEGSPIAFTISKVGSTSSSYSVTYTTSDTTATAGSDYVAASATVTFGPTETTRTVYVQTSQDDLVESSETFLISLSGPTGTASIGDGDGTGTIDDVPPDQGCFDPESGMPVPCGLSALPPPAEETQKPGDVE